MAIFYNPISKGFYNNSIHTAIPAGSIEITPSEHSSLLESQSSGFDIVVQNGRVVSVARVQEITWQNIRDARDKKLRDSDWTQLNDSPMNDLLKQQWATYRTALRNITEAFQNPSLVVWPKAP